MVAYVPSNPDLFLDVAESPQGYAIRVDEFVQLLRHASRHSSVLDALKRRLPRWLGRWSRQSRSTFSNPMAVQERQDKRERGISERLASLTASETAMFQRLTIEEFYVSALPLDHVAALTIAGMSLEPFATGFVGWAFTQAIAPDLPVASDDIAWAIRINTVDSPAVAAVVESETRAVQGDWSEAMKKGAAIALRLTGDIGQQGTADLLDPRESTDRFRRKGIFGETDPYDPTSSVNLDIATSMRALNALNPLNVWILFGTTSADHDLELATPPLARFEPIILATKLREVVQSAPMREGMKLRQLGWRLPQCSPLFDAQTVNSVRIAYNALLADPAKIEVADRPWVTGQIVMSLLPHLDAADQLALLLSMPAECPLYVALGHGLKELTAPDLERALTNAIAANDSIALARTLFFPATIRHTFTARTSDMVSDCAWHTDDCVALCAADALVLAENPEAFRRFLQLATAPAATVTPVAYARGRALAHAVVHTSDASKLFYVVPRFLGYVAKQLRGSALDSFVISFSRLLEILLSPSSVAHPETFELNIETFEDTSRAWLSVDEVDGGDVEGAIEDLTQLNPKGKKQRRAALLADWAAYAASLNHAEAHAIAEEPVWDGQRELLEHAPDRFKGWIDRILAISDPAALKQIRNLALSMASTLGTTDPTRAAAIFRRFRNVDPIVRVHVGHQRLPFYDRCLFAAGDGPELISLREQLFEGALDDATIADAVAAAEAYGARTWLVQYVRRLLDSTTPLEQALGVTISGFAAPHPQLIVERRDGEGFLSSVARGAYSRQQSARWASHWLGCAIRSIDSIDFWRFTQLAIPISDNRTVAELITVDVGMWRPHIGQLLSELKKVAQSVNQDRKATLFGIKGPSTSLVSLLRLQHA